MVAYVKFFALNGTGMMTLGQVMAQGIDSEFDCTSYAHQIAERYAFVGRYYRMPPPHSSYPTLTRAEASALSAAGLSIVSLWEFISGSKGRIKSLNYASGQDEGARAYKQAAAIPQPAGTPIYFAVDEGYDPQDQAEAGPIDDYFRGINDAFAASPGQGQQPRYKVGVYGPGAVCQWLKARGRVTYTWLANAKKWPGYSYGDWNIKQGFRDKALPFGNDVDQSKDGAGLWQMPGPPANVA